MGNLSNQQLVCGSVLCSSCNQIDSDLLRCHAMLLVSFLQIPEEMVTQSRNSYMEAELMVPPLDELGKATEEEVDEDVEEHEEGSYYSHLERLVQNLQEEAKDKSKGWVSRPTPDHTELAYKKVREVHKHEEDLLQCHFS